MAPLVPGLGSEQTYRSSATEAPLREKNRWHLPATRGCWNGSNPPLPALSGSTGCGPLSRTGSRGHWRWQRQQQYPWPPLSPPARLPDCYRGRSARWPARIFSRSPLGELSRLSPSRLSTGAWHAAFLAPLLRTGWRRRGRHEVTCRGGGGCLGGLADD